MRTLYINGMRGDVIETRHKVHAIAIQGNRVLYRSGNEQLVTPMRSAAKPFMICPQIELCSKYGLLLTDKQISLMISSHNGENEHRRIAQSILELSNSTVNDLYCGTHLPFFDWLYDDFWDEKDLMKRQLFHNCSGKHAGMLLLAMLLGSSKVDYWKTTHPVQQIITNSVKSLLEISKRSLFSMELDGCGVPTYCITLKEMAEAYQRLYKDERLQPVINSAMNEPDMIAGKERIETDIIRHCQYFAKSGSEGIFCITIPNIDISIALKVEDGNDDAAEAAIAEILSILDLLTEEQKEILDKYRCLKIYTSTGVVSGQFLPMWI